MAKRTKSESLTNSFSNLLPYIFAVYVTEKDYLDFQRLFALESALAYFVTRAKKNLAFRRIYTAQINKQSGLRCDQTIRLTTYKSAKDYLKKLQRIKCFDKDQAKTYVFLTNNFEVTAMK